MIIFNRSVYFSGWNIGRIVSQCMACYVFYSRLIHTEEEEQTNNKILKFMSFNDFL